ncbi:hypothetical protein [Halorussus halophilus]|uniref:hypothetical protein n=1 Tax=Halorussus halophilus TaxID=2650975 RepID=UPI001300DB2B|nr:hypothetical protein [Halorussus halophilus]
MADETWSAELKHPRAVAALRVGLYLLAAILAVGFAGVALASLLLVFVFGSVALAVTGDVNVVAVAGLAALVLVVSVGLFVGLLSGVRRVEWAIREADRKPDPRDVLTDQYVAGDIDELELERALEDLLFEVADERTGTATTSETATESGVTVASSDERPDGKRERLRE